MRHVRHALVGLSKGTIMLYPYKMKCHTCQVQILNMRETVFIISSLSHILNYVLVCDRNYIMCKKVWRSRSGGIPFHSKIVFLQLLLMSHTGPSSQALAAGIGKKFINNLIMTQFMQTLFGCIWSVSIVFRSVKQWACN